MNTPSVPAPATAAGIDAAASLTPGAEQAAPVPFRSLLLPVIAGQPPGGKAQAEIRGGPQTLGPVLALAEPLAEVESAEDGERLPEDAGNGLPAAPAIPLLPVVTAAHQPAAPGAPAAPVPGRPGAVEAGAAAVPPAPGPALPGQGLSIASADAAGIDADRAVERPTPAGSPAAQQAGLGEAAAARPPANQLTALSYADLSAVHRLATPRRGQADIEARPAFAAARAVGTDGARLAAAFQAHDPGAAPPPGFAQPPGSPEWSTALEIHLRVMLERGERQALIRLHPQELGRLEIRIALGAERVDVNFTVQHPQVASAVQAHLPQLQQMLAAQGMSLGDASVFQQQAGRDGDEGPGRHVGGAGSAPDDAPIEAKPLAWRPLHGGLIDAYA